MKTLTKEHGRLTIEKIGSDYFYVENLSDGYRQLQPLSGAFVSETYFDLAGMTIEDKTLFFQGATVQEISNPFCSNAVAGNNCLVVDLMSTKPISDNDLLFYNVFANMAGSSLTFDQVIYGRIRFFNIDLDNQAGAVMIPLSDNQTGSLEPTASDRIYSYRVYIFAGGNADGQYFGLGSRHILQAKAEQEKEFEYMMRLKRSYELQNQPDRD